MRDYAGDRERKYERYQSFVPDRSYAKKSLLAPAKRFDYNGLQKFEY